MLIHVRAYGGYWPLKSVRRALGNELIFPIYSTQDISGLKLSSVCPTLLEGRDANGNFSLSSQLPSP